MKKEFRKYFVVTLSLMLILSNFSFATQLMICEMMGDSKVCDCAHRDNPKPDGLSLTQERNKCCNEETTELSNSNTLLSLNNEQQDQYIYSNISLALNVTVDIESNYNNTILYTHDKAHLPEIDIPIFNSSLLI
ncbi:MAG TPA: hypothetical protein PKE39_00720 [Ignavibacteria bacterium]|nr:hypothetical protein [Ignavibacteria bacterium]